MNYVFQFGDVWAARWDLLWGSWLTIQLSAAAMVLGLLVAVLCALGKTMGPKPIRWAGRTLHRGDPQHAVPGADLLHLLRPAARSASALSPERGGAAGDGGEPRRLRDRDRPRRHRKSIRKRPDRGRPGARPARRLQVFRYVVLKPALSTRLPRADEPVHPADAELQRRLGDLGAATSPPTANDLQSQHLPQLRDLHRGHRDLPGAVAGCSPALFGADPSRACSHCPER